VYSLFPLYTANMAPKWLKKNALKNRDDQRTNAAELTLRQSIFPIVLVTILFFLWVSDTSSHRFALSIRRSWARDQANDDPPKILTIQLIKAKLLFIKKLMLTPLPTPGLLLRPPRHPKQTLPKHPQHHARPLLRSTSRLLRRLPPRLARPRQLDPAPLRLQSNFHLGPVSLRHRISRSLALHFE
jgi:hypothetical protein